MLTPALATELLRRYETMLEAARGNDWERLGALGDEAAALREQAAATPGDPAKLPDADRQALATTIARILEIEREILSHAEPALESTRKLLSSTVRGRSMRAAYGKV